MRSGRLRRLGARVVRIGAALALPLVALTLPLLTPSAARCATILEKTVHHRIQGDGSVTQTNRLRVLMETTGDLERWATYPIYLDDHRRLLEVETWAQTPAGERVEVKPKDHDTIEYPGAGVLAGSQRYQLVEFPNLPTGSVLHLAWTVREDPYFPSDAVAFGGEDSIASLRIEVEGPATLRHRLDGVPADWPVKIQESAGGRLLLVGEGVPELEADDLAPERNPVLRYGWGDATSWEDVAGWWRELRQALPTSPRVAEVARRETAGASTPRQRLDALLRYARESVRYVAVEMGIGGFQPSPPPEVLERGWGDCKDKATLLTELLAAVGVEAHPALIHSGDERRVDLEFPSPGQFNHAIVAVPVTAELELTEGDPVSAGYLFLDPTDDDGGAAWLHPSVQGQHALVVTGETSALVPTPELAERDRRLLDARLTLDGDGTARGRLTLALEGRYGDAGRRWLSAGSDAQQTDLVRRLVANLLPAVELQEVTWADLTLGESGEPGVPRAVITADVTLPGLVRGQGDRRSFTLPGIHATPEPNLLEERSEAVGVSVGTVRETWTFDLAPGDCPPEARAWEAANGAGSFSQTVGPGEPGQLILERHVELGRRWVEPSDVEALRELALEETRARKRRVRFGACSDEGTGDEGASSDEDSDDR